MSASSDTAIAPTCSSDVLNSELLIPSNSSVPRPPASISDAIDGDGDRGNGRNPQSAKDRRQSQRILNLEQDLQQDSCPCLWRLP